MCFPTNNEGNTRRHEAPRMFFHMGSGSRRTPNCQLFGRFLKRCLRRYVHFGGPKSDQIVHFLDAFLKRCLRRYAHFDGPKSDQIVRFLDTVLKRCDRRYCHFDGPKSARNGVARKNDHDGLGLSRALSAR